MNRAVRGLAGGNCQSRPNGSSPFVPKVADYSIDNLAHVISQVGLRFPSKFGVGIAHPQST